MIDFQMINVHTGWYVGQSREEVNLIIGRGSIQCDGTHDGFSYC